ncbi:flagellar motor protein MotB [Roseovarius pelagicus]|uniref:Chemotaxis protein MotB n=1 Tax=Roseovarius pelagicus TaxID=2980108 RepID=A0ABY6DEN3_9RHOB|nr:flagellar motor protein MotB [Roseovarius pelagicus]UXX82265.1 chemotaxis protein MotB [Roseovarius pelagicus]
MSAQSNARPIIIKRKKIVQGGGHHGGAWKVAYADFVTAMMAFFLLMWLLNATTEKQRKGLADYFSPTIPISRVSGGGDGDFGGQSVFAEDTLPKEGTGASQRKPTDSDRARGDTGVDQTAAEEMQAVKKALDSLLRGTNGESMVSRRLQRHIITRVTDEGLVIELFSVPDAPLFEAGSATPAPILHELVGLLAELGGLVTNALAVEGHMAAPPVVLREKPVWDVTTTRANVTRQLLEAAGMTPLRMKRVTGHADRELATPEPMAMRNNRIEVIFLRSDI